MAQRPIFFTPQVIVSYGAGFVFFSSEQIKIIYCLFFSRFDLTEHVQQNTEQFSLERAF